jgi:hypothetical protein
MNCRLDIQKYLNRQVKSVVNNLGSFDDSGFAYVTKDFNVNNLREIKDLNSKFKFKFLEHKKSDNPDLPDHVQMNLPDKLVQHYINKYNKEQIEAQARQIQLEDAKRLGIEEIDYNDNYLFAKQQEPNGLNRFPTVGDVQTQGEVNYTLKVVDILNSNKAKQVFDKGIKNNWTLNKVLDEIGGFGNRTGYKNLFTEEQLNSNVKNLDREQLALDIASNYSYTIEINTAKTKGLTNWRIIPGPGGEGANWAVEWTNNQDGDLELFDTEQEARNFIKNKQTVNENTQYYSNLTVPGGTNYTENEIYTPLITPSIKGHAQFSTDNGIGWFRSDDKSHFNNIKPIEIKDSKGNSYFFKPNRERTTFQWVKQDGSEFKGELRDAQELPESVKAQLRGKYDETLFEIPSKTRRILEVQSDLFQKGRDKDMLIVNPNVKKAIEKGAVGYMDITGKDKKLPENQFLQLLNKGNNWVTFFVKSIIQDSAKKGYEKVLFPSGKTVEKI